MSDDLAAFRAFVQARLGDDERGAIEEYKSGDKRRAVRLRRELEVKQTIFAVYEQQPGYDLPEGVAEGRDDSERATDEAILGTLHGVVMVMATVWAGHPGYRAEWKP